MASPLAVDLPLVSVVDVPDGVGRAKRTARVARGRLNPDVIENAGSEDFPVGNAIKRDAAGHHKILAAGQLPGGAGQAKDDVLGHLLNGERHIHVDLGNFRLRFAARDSKKLLPFCFVDHLQAGGVLEVIHIQKDRAIFSDVDQFGCDLLLEIRGALRVRDFRTAPGPSACTRRC